MPPRPARLFDPETLRRIFEVQAQEVPAAPEEYIPQFWYDEHPEEARYEDPVRGIERNQYIDSRIWRAWQEPTIFGLDINSEDILKNAEPEEISQQELDKQWKELMFGKAQP